MTAKGDRVELIRCNDPHTRLSPGDRGTVMLVDSLGTVHVKWDSGSSLGLCREDGDAWRVIGHGEPPRGQAPPSERLTATDADKELLA